MIDYSPNGFSNRSDERQHGCRVYEIDPQKIGVAPQQLLTEIKYRKQKIRGADYSYLSENCADQVCSVLRAAGANNLPDKSGVFHVATPTMGGSIVDVVSDKVEKAIDIPVIGDIAGWVSGQATSGLASASQWITGQDTVEEYCQQNGRLVETRVSEEKYCRTIDKYECYMEILHDPAAYKEKCKKERDLEIMRAEWKANKELIDPILKDTLPEEEYQAFLEQVKEDNTISQLFGTRTDDTDLSEKKAEIKAEYEAQIALANLPTETLKARARELYRSCGDDELLRSKLDKIGNELQPVIAAQFKVERIQQQKEIEERLARLGFRRRPFVDTDTKPKKKKRTQPSINQLDERVSRA